MNKNNKKAKIPVVVIFAPTASGKTALTYELFCEKGSQFFLNDKSKISSAQIISADSMQVYKGMDIGTAKPTPEFCKDIPHHLIDLVLPDVQFNVSDFVDLADKKCKELWQKNILPVVVGGTGFYIRNFLFGNPKTPESNELIRNQLKEKLERVGNQAMYAELQTIDLASAEKIHVNDSYRILRALEVFYTTGKKRSDFSVHNEFRDEYEFLFIVLEPPRDVLYERIKKRVDIMFDQGLQDEIQTLKKQGYTIDTPGMKAIGYKEFFMEENIEKIKYSIKHNSCKYAKKQYTYIKDIPGSKIIEYQATQDDIAKVKNEITKFIENSL